MKRLLYEEQRSRGCPWPAEREGCPLGARQRAVQRGRLRDRRTGGVCLWQGRLLGPCEPRASQGHPLWQRRGRRWGRDGDGALTLCSSRDTEFQPPFLLLPHKGEAPETAFLPLRGTYTISSSYEFGGT